MAKNVFLPATGNADLYQLHFTVDSALLHELGERLVGQPHIALAELVKNAYDADARHVRITIDQNRIVVEDDGHGMTLEEFREFWMRIGTPHKQDQVYSRRLRRPLTGSKGVGRLAVQFLARKINIFTTSINGSTELRAHVDWDEAVTAGELTSATATYSIHAQRGAYVYRTRHGTRIELKQLNETWTEPAVAQLANELWSLQPPFGAKDRNDARSFEIELRSSEPGFREAFEKRLKANLNLWSARVKGKLLPYNQDDPPNTRRFSCELTFRYANSERFEFTLENCLLDSVDYDVRIFSLVGKQEYGIGVEAARQYLKKFGGVHIYDAGFHLPYYGPEVDWLKIEITHSHRLSKSEYLPSEYHIVEGMNNLPTMTRIYGTVTINTAIERRAAQRAKRPDGSSLAIQVSRDRLVDNEAYKQLVRLVRTALDLYAMRETARRLYEAEKTLGQRAVAALDVPDLERILRENKPRIPPDLYQLLLTGIRRISDRNRAFREMASAELGLVGSLATAGLTSLALEHESNKELIVLGTLASDMAAIRTPDPAVQRDVLQLAESIKAWISRARSTRAALSSLLEADDRSIRERLNAAIVLDRVTHNSAVFLRGVPVSLENIDPTLKLPKGSMAEWSAIFQNVLINAVNALLDTDRPQITISTRCSDEERSILVQDNGVGIDLTHADEFFRPFARQTTISPERRALGLGGTGLGLTIVRMIANSVSATAKFVPADSGFATAFELSWKEQAL